MDKEGYRKFVVEQQNAKHYDSQQRLKTYEISFIKRFLGIEGDSNKCKYTLNDYKQVQDDIRMVEADILRVQNRIDTYKNENIDTRRIIEDIKNKIDELDSAWYGVVFPEPYRKAYERYHRSILSGICPFCGNAGTLYINMNECFYCKHHILANNDANLIEIEQNKKVLDNDLRVVKQNFKANQTKIESCNESISEMETELSIKNRLKHDIESYLNDNSDENYQKLKLLESRRSLKS